MKITQASVDLSSKKLILSQRPRLRVSTVIVRPLEGHNRFEREQYVRGQFYISNIGGTPAIITNIGCWVHWTLNPLPMERPYEGKEGIIKSKLFAIRENPLL